MQNVNKTEKCILKWFFSHFLWHLWLISYPGQLKYNLRLTSLNVLYMECSSIILLMPRVTLMPVSGGEPESGLCFWLALLSIWREYVRKDCASLSCWTSVSQYYYHNPNEKQRWRAVPLYQQSPARRPDRCLIAVVIAYIITEKWCHNMGEIMRRWIMSSE